MIWHHFFVAVQHVRQVEWKNQKTHWYEAVSSALNFPFLKEVSRICFFLTLSTSKIEEVSQNCFVFDVVKFKKMLSSSKTERKSRRIVSFSTLSSSKLEEVLQNSCVFKLADRQIDR